MAVELPELPSIEVMAPTAMAFELAAFAEEPIAIALFPVARVAPEDAPSDVDVCADPIAIAFAPAELFKVDRLPIRME
ncbi:MULTISPECIES: hypothetical protein [Xanthomonas]|uniref:hypothetical protein n=1 Tax=Xanthomonas TaxID=338 RepID=UPI001CC5D50F|nr:MULTISPECIES: hypothetical protein [Xanthomonas]